eukprot:RCo034222
MRHTTGHALTLHNTTREWLAQPTSLHFFSFLAPRRPLSPERAHRAADLAPPAELVVVGSRGVRRVVHGQRGQPQLLLQVAQVGFQDGLLRDSRGSLKRLLAELAGGLLKVRHKAHHPLEVLHQLRVTACLDPLGKVSWDLAALLNPFRVHDFDCLHLQLRVAAHDEDHAILNPLVGGLLGLLHDLRAEGPQGVLQVLRGHQQPHVHRGAGLGEGCQVDAGGLVQDLPPDVLAEVGADRAEQQSLHLHKAAQHGNVHGLPRTGAVRAVLIPGILQAEPAGLDGIAKHLSCVVLVSVHNGLVQDCGEHAVKERELALPRRRGARRGRSEDLLGPLHLLRQLQNLRVDHVEHEVGVVEAVPGIREG